MRQLFTKIFTLIFAITLTTVAFGQSITAVGVSPNPTNCTNTTVAISATQLCINYIYIGVNSVVGANTIDMYLDWTSPGPICLGALAFISENSNLGNIPDGTYTLNVIARLDGVIQNTSVQQMVVTSCCVVQASAQGATNVCLGDNVTLINTSTNATSSTWIQNGNNISTADTLTLSFATAGTYPIQLSSTNGSCTDVETINVVVNNYPTVNLGPDTSTCVGQPILLNAGTSGATSYAWSMEQQVQLFLSQIQVLIQ
jgi:hypothetical protein